MDSLELKYRRHASDNRETWEPLPGSFRTSSNDWLVVHDLFHHRPSDCGTLAEELATLGAEYYVNYEGSGRLAVSDDFAGVLPTPGMNALTRSAAGIVGMACKSDDGEAAQAFLLQPAQAQLASDLAESVFAAAERVAVAELEQLLWGKGNDPAWRAAKQAFCAKGLVASWIRLGYQNAKQRYPDQARARAGWNEAVEQLYAVSTKAQPEAVLVASRQGYQATFEVIA